MRVFWGSRGRRFGDPAVRQVADRLAEEVAYGGVGAFPEPGILAEDRGLRINTIQHVLRQAREAELLGVFPERGGVMQLRLDVAELLAQPLTESGCCRFATPGGGPT